MTSHHVHVSKCATHIIIEMLQDMVFIMASYGTQQLQYLLHVMQYKCTDAGNHTTDQLQGLVCCVISSTSYEPNIPCMKMYLF